MGDNTLPGLGLADKEALEKILNASERFIAHCQKAPAQTEEFTKLVEGFKADVFSLRQQSKHALENPLPENEQKLRDAYDAAQTKMDSIIVLGATPAVKVTSGSKDDTVPGAPGGEPQPAVAIKKTDPAKPSEPAPVEVGAAKKPADKKPEESKDDKLVAETEDPDKPKRGHIKWQSDAGDIRAAFAAAFAFMLELLTQLYLHRKKANKHNEQKHKGDDLSRPHNAANNMGLVGADGSATPEPGASTFDVHKGVSPVADGVTEVGIELASEAKAGPESEPGAPPSSLVLNLQPGIEKKSNQETINQTTITVAANKAQDKVVHSSPPSPASPSLGP